MQLLIVFAAAVVLSVAHAQTEEEEICKKIKGYESDCNRPGKGSTKEEWATFKGCMIEKLQGDDDLKYIVEACEGKEEKEGRCCIGEEVHKICPSIGAKKSKST